ncbi:MAG TPA: DUF937 domain-containing protein [Polyangia bacterium]|nr:DUF937 domain-containing protein [Polyangia bacterium]
MSQGTVEGPDLSALLSRQLTPELVHETAARLGENEERTRSALSASVPSVVATLSEVAASPDGASRLSSAIDQVEAPGKTTGGSGFDSTAAREAGVVLFDAEAGPRAESMAEDVSRSSGVTTGSAHELLGAVTGAALVTLHERFGQMGPEAVRAVLAGDRPVNGPPTGPATGRAIQRRPARNTNLGWLIPLALALAVLILTVPLLYGMRHGPARPLSTRIAHPPVVSPTGRTTVPAPGPATTVPHEGQR